jgi:hypothetical protein
MHDDASPETPILCTLTSSPEMQMAHYIAVLEVCDVKHVKWDGGRRRRVKHVIT